MQEERERTIETRPPIYTGEGLESLHEDHVPTMAIEKDTARLRSLCFFLPTGRTFTFRQVVIEQDNETAIVIRYFAMSDGREKTATFYKTQIAGVAKDR